MSIEKLVRAPAENNSVGARKSVNIVHKKQNLEHDKHEHEVVNRHEHEVVNKTEEDFELVDKIFTVSEDSLLWVNGYIYGQPLPMMIDTGATPNCIALRCVSASPCLKVLPKKRYNGRKIIDANGNVIQPKYVISTSLVVGQPSISQDTEFLVIESLPFSCILGQKTLSKFKQWTVSNITHQIIINNNHKLPFYDDPPHPTNDHLKLFSMNKIHLKPHQTFTVSTRVSGPTLSAFRPVTN